LCKSQKVSIITVGSQEPEMHEAGRHCQVDVGKNEAP